MHVDNLIFILLVLVAMLFRWLASAASKASKGPEQQQQRRSTSTPPPLPRPPAESDAERIRRFLEALGQPTGTAPPARVAPRTDIPARPVAPVQPPREMVAGPLRKRRTTEPKRIFVPGTTPVVAMAEERRRPQAPIPVFDVQQPAAAPEPPPSPSTAAQLYATATKPAGPSVQRKIDIAALIASGSGLREAVILREILGPPRSLQSLDAIGSA